VVETPSGETDIAVIELFNPVYDASNHTATYEAAVLSNWEDSLELGFTEAPTDLAALAPTFGAAHLFIDDCPDAKISCWTSVGSFDDFVGDLPGAIGTCWDWVSIQCLPCADGGGARGREWANAACDRAFPAACHPRCFAHLQPV